MEFSRRDKEIIDNSFANGELLCADVRNAFAAHSLRISAGNSNVENYRPVPTYEEYFRRVSSRYRNPEARYRYIMDRSDPGAVARYNARVARFNADLERIVRRKDTQAVTDFHREVDDLIMGPEEAMAA